MALDPVNLVLYYADRTTSPNQLRRYNGTTETASIGTFSGTSSGNVILRMGFSGGTGYAIGSPGDATVTITDNNDVPYVAVSTTASAKESGTAGTFKIAAVLDA